MDITEELCKRDPKCFVNNRWVIFFTSRCESPLNFRYVVLILNGVGNNHQPAHLMHEIYNIITHCVTGSKALESRCFLLPKLEQFRVR